MRDRLITRHHGHRPRLEVTAPTRCALVADPGKQLNRNGQGTSGTVVRQVLEELRDGSTETVDRLLELPPASVRLGTDLSAPQLHALLSTHDLLFLLAHHEADRRDPATGELLPGCGVQLCPDGFFSGEDLLRAVPPNGRVPWLLCWPCCHSCTGEAWRRNWRTAEAGSAAAGLADAALRLGVPLFIGTLFEVHADFVARLIAPLLGALDERQGVAESLRRARCGLRGASPAEPFHAGTLPGLAFPLLGDGGAALLSAGRQRLDCDPIAPLVHTCREPLAAGVCGRAVAQGEPDHATHQCDRHGRPDDPLTACAARHTVPRSQLVGCGHPGCHQTYCRYCHTHRFARCWRQASARGPLLHEAEGIPCADSHRLHPTEPRTVRHDEPGFTKALCPDCWAEHKRRLDALLNA